MALMADRLIGALRETFRKVADPRSGSNTQYGFDDIAMAGFSLFYMQSPSFLEHQRVFETVQGRNACGSLFGIRKLPKDTHIRMQLDRIDCADIYEGFDIALGEMRRHAALEPYQGLGGRTLIALDGSEFHNSRNLHCPQCQKRVKNKSRDDEYVEYYHSVLAAVVVGVAHPHALPLRPEFISPQDGDRKQDCETKAAYRWLDRNARRYAELKPIYLGDDLYAKQPMCRKVVDSGADFIFRVKKGDHKTLFEFLDGVKWPEKRQTIKTPGRDRPNKTFHYRWTEHKMPLSMDKEPFEAYYVELRISEVGKRAGAAFRFITSIKPNKRNVAEIIACGRARWRIENEGFNLLKNHGYHLEHNFGHGNDGLSNTLLTMNLIAFAFHAVCAQLCKLWKKARELYRRKRFFTTMNIATEWQYFGSWRELLTQLANPQLRPIAQTQQPP